MLDLLPDELRHVERLVDSLSEVSDTDCSLCGRSVAGSEIARHLVACQGPYEEPVDDFAAYGEALERLEEALEAAGADKQVVIEVNDKYMSLLLEMLDRERAGVLTAVSRLVGRHVGGGNAGADV